MRTTILFGGTNKERLVSVATAQALHEALAEADLWFWDADDSVHETTSKILLGHARPFEDPFKPGGQRVGQTIDRLFDRLSNTLTAGLEWVLERPRVTKQDLRRRFMDAVVGVPEP